MHGDSLKTQNYLKMVKTTLFIIQEPTFIPATWLNWREECLNFLHKMCRVKHYSTIGPSDSIKIIIIAQTDSMSENRV